MMRHYLTAFIIGVTFLSNAQFSDDFSDGDFTTAPIWTGDVANFEVTGDNELHLLAPAATDVSHLSVPTTTTSGTWDFYCRMEFDPSSSNYTRVYLISDNADLEGSLNGYYVMIGNTSDEISLYRQDGATTTEILDGLDESVGSAEVNVRIRVTRDGAGNWELLRDTTGGYSFISEGTVNDNTYTSSSNFGFSCHYTSTRSELFYFDNLGDPYIDLSPPDVLSLSIVSTNEVDILFSEPVDVVTAENTANYSVNLGVGNPTSCNVDGGNPALVHLSFSAAFTNATDYELTLNNVEDLFGNAIPITTLPFFFFIPEIAVPGDVIVSEIMADPTPVVGLPELEWFEVYNRSDKYFDLDGWVVTDGATSETLTSYVLGPGEYVVILNSGDGALFGITNFLEGFGMPTLTNAEDDIVLRNPDGVTIDSVHYTDDWYNDPTRDDGGYTLEIKHLNSPCQDKSNWGASVSVNGGTPGEQNSIYTAIDDTDAPFITQATVQDLNTIDLIFSETMDTTISPIFSFNPSITVNSIDYISPNELTVLVDFLDGGVIYDLTVTAGADCWGNPLNEMIKIGLPEIAEEGDVLINEILFNPLTNSDDYVELYNNSDKIINLENLYLGNFDEGIDNLLPVSSSQYLLYPGEYVCVTEDSLTVINDYIIYGLGRFIQTDIPTYVNDSATVYLVKADTSIVDYVHYDEDYHFELLSDVDGKSLERILFNGPSNDPNNWKTAAETANWGTPGYKNSQNYSNESSGTASVDPKIFSPDGDGFQDVVTINLALVALDNVIDIEIFDHQGRLIKKLVDNGFIGADATYIWDGINEDGEKAPIGNYVVLVTVRSGENVNQYKMVVVVAGNL